MLLPESMLHVIKEILTGLMWICSFVTPRNGNIPRGVAKWNIPITRGNNILWNYNEKVCALHNLIKNAPTNFIFDIATDLR